MDTTHTRMKKRVFQISGIRILKKMKQLVKGIKELDATFIRGKGYVEKCTHLIVPDVIFSEKFIAACAAGKWVLTPEYVTDSVKSGRWLAEEPYEVETSAAIYPSRLWRERVAAGSLDGAFRGWRVVLRIQDPSRRDMFYRLLRAGKAIVYIQPPSSSKSVTHVFVKPASDIPESPDEPCFPVTHIIQHLFGDDCDESRESLDPEDCEENESSDAEESEHESGLETVLAACTLDKEDRCEEASEQESVHEEDFMKLEAELLMHARTIEERRTTIDAISYVSNPKSMVMPTVHPVTQESWSKGEFSNARLMVEGEQFDMAMHNIVTHLMRTPGTLPPAELMASILHHALQGEASPMFYRDIQVALDRLLHYNAPWLFPRRMRKYYTDVLQCPVCQRGLWSFLETVISCCMSREDTCHPLTGQASPALLDFHRYLLMFVIRLFQGECSAFTSIDWDREPRAPVVLSNPSLYGMWTIWERSTVLSVAVKRLCELLIHAVVWEQDHPKRDLTQKPLVDILLELLSVLVDFWCRQHMKLNRALMETSMNDLAEHIAVLGQDLSPEVLVDLVHRMPSRLGLVTADAVFRHLCHRSGFSLGDEPLSVKKMVSSYLPALGRLGGGCSRADSSSRRSWPGNEPAAHSWTGPGTASGPSSPDDTSPGKENQPDKQQNLPRGVNKVNRAGSDLLQQPTGSGSSPLDLVATAAQREELLLSARRGDLALAEQASVIHDLPLLEVCSGLLGNLLVSYLWATGSMELLLCNLQPDPAAPPPAAFALAHKLAGALAACPLQAVTAAWTERRALRLAEDMEELVELGRGGGWRGHVSPAVAQCQGENTRRLMDSLEEIKDRAEAIMAKC